MLDSWEIFGRLLTDDAFRKSIFTGPFSASYQRDGNKKAIVPRDEYKEARDRVTAASGKMADRPISLMALGELLVSRTATGFIAAANQLATSIAATGIKTVGRDYYFYVALGAMVIDDQLRGVLQAPSAFDKFGFNSVAPQDRADLVLLFDPNKNPAVAKDAVAFCKPFWVPDCHLKMLFWKDHNHSVANP